MSFDFTFFVECLRSGITYLPDTIILTFFPIFIGIAVGTLIAIIRVYKIPVIHKILGGFITIYQGIPTVVALMIYNLIFMTQFNNIASFLHIKVQIADIDNIWIGIFTLSLHAICIMGEAVRGAFLSIDKGQFEAGYAVGLTKPQTLRRIVVPQVIPVALPMLGNAIIGTIKNSSVVMAVGITEVMAGSILPCSRTYSFFEGYAAAAVIYWVFTVAVGKLNSLIEQRGNRYRRKLV